MKTKFTALLKKAPFWVAFLFLLASALPNGVQAASVPNTYLLTVTNTADTGPGSLRAAIATANSLAVNPDVKADRPVVITFDPEVFNGTSPITPIALTGGVIEIENHVRIFSSAAAPNAVTISGSGNGTNGIFKVPSGTGSDGLLYNVTIENIALVDAKAPKGGAINNAANLILKKVSFLSNEATEAGGAIYNNGRLTIYDGTFQENKYTGPDEAYKGGGAIYNETAAELSILDGTGAKTTFTENEAVSKGGAIFNATDATMVITDTEFTRNLATKPTGGDAMGGAIYNLSILQNSIRDTQFTENKSTGGSSLPGGGAIFNREGVLDIHHAEFTNNASEGAGSYGGAIFNRGGATASATQLTITGSVFTANKAFDEGGALYNRGATATIKDTKFEGNTLTGASGLGGGAIATDNETSANDNFTILTNVDFKDNQSPTSGGAIRLKGQNAELTITGGTFEGNKANAGSGGAIHNFNSAKVLAISRATFKGNVATVNGGAIENSEPLAGGELSITNSVFDGNKAGQRYGGAINNYLSKLTLANTNFSNNEVGTPGGGLYQGRGGAIYQDDGGALTIKGGLFDANKAYGKTGDNGGQGGAIHNGNTNLHIEGAIFTNNEITGNNTSNAIDGGSGGAVITKNELATSAFIVNSIFKGNSGAGDYGNAVRSLYNSTIANSTLTGNGTADLYVSRYANNSFLINSRVDNINSYGNSQAKAAYSSFTAAKTVDDIVAGTNNTTPPNAGTLVAEASSAIWFADLAAATAVWKKTDGTVGSAFTYTSPAYGLSGTPTVYDKYADGTTRIITTPANAINVNGALADASGNAAPVPGGGGIISTKYDATLNVIVLNWAAAIDDATAASALTYKIYQSDASPVDITGTALTTLTGGTTYSASDFSKPYFAVVVSDGTSEASYKETVDVIAPLVTEVKKSPLNNSIVAIEGAIVITFSEAINTPGDVYLNDVLLSGTPTISGLDYSIPFSGLDYDTDYAIRIVGFEDAAGNVMVDDKSKSFSTVTASTALVDGTKPEVWNRYDNSADSIYVSGATAGNISIAFTERMSTIYGTVVLTSVLPASTLTLPDAGTWSADTTVYTILYTGLTAGTEYSISIRDFRDLADNIMVTNNRTENKFTATADDTTPPSVGVKAVLTTDAGSDQLVFMFSESMDGSKVPASITITPTIGVLNPGFWSDNHTVYTVTTTADFNSSGTYTATFPGFADAAGNALSNSTDVPIAIGAVPMIVSIAPANAATDVPISGNVVITFSEAMNTAIAGTVVLNDGTNPPVTLVPTAATWSAGNTVYTIPYSGLANNTAYTITVSGFENTAAGVMVTNSSNSFTTVAAGVTTYTLTFDAQGGSVSPSTKTVTAGVAVGALPTPSRTNYTFNGWYTVASASGVQYTAATIASASLTLYAAWTAVPPTNPNPDPNPDPNPNPNPDPDPDPTDPETPTGIEDAPKEANVWALGGQQLSIYTPQAQKVRIYTVTGQLSKQLALPAGETLTITLQRGLYIVTFERGHNQKVLIK